MENTLHFAWNKKFLLQRKFDRVTKKVLPFETTFVLTKLEGIIEFQDRVVEELENKIAELELDKSIHSLSQIKGIKSALSIVKNIKPKP